MEKLSNLRIKGKPLLEYLYTHEIATIGNVELKSKICVHTNELAISGRDISYFIEQIA